MTDWHGSKNHSFCLEQGKTLMCDSLQSSLWDQAKDKTSLDIIPLLSFLPSYSVSTTFLLASPGKAHLMNPLHMYTGLRDAS